MKTIITAFLLFFSIVSVFSQKYISYDEAMDDLDAYHQTLFDVHYNPMLYIDKAQYDTYVNNIKASIKDSITIEDFMIKLHKITALIDDSHTGPAIFQGAL